jgi:hypothetical protein
VTDQTPVPDHGPTLAERILLGHKHVSREVWEAIKWAQMTCDPVKWGRYVLIACEHGAGDSMLYRGRAWQIMGQLVADVVAASGDNGYALGEPRMELPAMEAAAELWLVSNGYAVRWMDVSPPRRPQRET